MKTETRIFFALACLAFLVLTFQLTGWPAALCAGGYSYTLLRALR